MYKATCADCKKVCEVPFKPNGLKPVYCRDCFPKNGGQVTTNHFSTNPRREFAPVAPRSQNDTNKLDELSRQLEALNTKFDKLLDIAENLSTRVK
jgi:CxxC-x17-CxxC domain-containing protein